LILARRAASVVNNNGEGFFIETVIDAVSKGKFPDPRVKRLSRNRFNRSKLDLPRKIEGH